MPATRAMGCDQAAPGWRSSLPVQAPVRSGSPPQRRKPRQCDRCLRSHVRLLLDRAQRTARTLQAVPLSDAPQLKNAAYFESHDDIARRQSTSTENILQTAVHCTGERPYLAGSERPPRSAVGVRQGLARRQRGPAQECNDDEPKQLQVPVSRLTAQRRVARVAVCVDGLVMVPGAPTPKNMLQPLWN